jgi:probable F420-dependent oxidoreductase
MKIGFDLPHVGTHAHRPEGIALFAREVERLGADSLWVGDRLFAAVDPQVNYPGVDGIPAEFRSNLDPFAVLSVAAAVTTRPLLGTSVLIAPWYAPPLLARSLTSIDRFSGGRLIAGLGVGWAPEEFSAVGVPMNERGARLDECLDVLEAYWTTNPVEHKGRFSSTPPSYVDVKPAHRIPVYLPAFSPAGIARAARRADGIIPATAPGFFDPAMVTGLLTQVRAGAEQAGRNPSEIDAILRVNTKAGESIESIVDVLVRARDEAGVEHAFVDLTFRDRADSVEHAIDLAGQILEQAK